jgi:hypothetical protein
VGIGANGAEAQIIADFGNDVGIRRLVLHCSGRTLHVHRADAGRGFEGDVHHLGVAFQAGDIVDDLRPGGDRGAGHQRLAGVDLNRNIYFAGQPFHDGQYAAQLLVSADGFRVRPGALAANVDQIGAIGDQLQRMVHGCIHIQKTSAV